MGVEIAGLSPEIGRERALNRLKSWADFERYIHEHCKLNDDIKYKLIEIVEHRYRKSFEDPKPLKTIEDMEAFILDNMHTKMELLIHEMNLYSMLLSHPDLYLQIWDTK